MVNLFEVSDLRKADMLLRAAGFVKFRPELIGFTLDEILRMDGVVILTDGKRYLYYFGDEGRAFNILLDGLGFIRAVIDKEAIRRNVSYSTR